MRGLSHAYNHVDSCSFQMAFLSKFAICLHDQQLYYSPLMGLVTSLVDQKLSSIEDCRLVTRQISNQTLKQKCYIMCTLWSFQDTHYTDDKHIFLGVSTAAGCPH